MNATQYDKSLQFLGHLFFLSWIVMSIVFYQERMLNFDTAYYTFNIIMTEDFYIPHQRYIGYLTQWVPLLIHHTGGSLKALIIAYSLSFMLWYYIFYNVAVYGFKNTGGGIFIAFVLVMTMRYKLYMAVSETPFTLAVAGLLIAWLSADKSQFEKLKKWQEVLIACGIILLMATGHPLIVLPVGVYYAFDLLYHQRWKDWGFWAVFSFTVSVYLYRLKAIQASSYEGNRISILENAETVLYNLGDYKVSEIVWRFLEMEYHIPFVIFMILIGVLLYQKKIFSALWLMIATVGLTALIIITCSYLNGHIYGLIDGYLGWIGFVWAIPLLFLVLKTERHYILNLTVVVLLLGYSWQRTYVQHDFFTKRLAFYTQVMDDYRTSSDGKFIVHARYFKWDRLWYQWAVGVETLLYSSLEGPKNSSTVYLQDWFDQQPDEREDTGDWFLGVKFAPFKYSSEELPARYFQLPSGKYQKVAPKQELEWEVIW